MAFQFRLEKILRYREQLEEDAKIRFAQAETKVQAAQNKRDALANDLELARKKAQENPLMTAAEFWVSDQYQRGLEYDLNAAELELKLALQVKEEAQKMLTERAIEKKMLVKLKERQQTVWNHEEKRHEQLFNDEIATVRYKKN
ncbi:MAG: flagellar export protein FliJ [Desulfovibrio sp.]|nr:flagellar export protein FliJ [Desulfovibrio sp.]